MAVSKLACGCSVGPDGFCEPQRDNFFAFSGSAPGGVVGDGRSNANVNEERVALSAFDDEDDDASMMTATSMEDAFDDGYEEGDDVQEEQEMPEDYSDGQSDDGESRSTMQSETY